MGRRQRNRACRPVASPCARDCRRTLQAPAIDNEIHAHCAHPETAAHRRRRRGVWAGVRGDQRRRCREGEMSEFLKPGSGDVTADKTSRDVERKVHTPTVAVSLIVNNRPRAIPVEPRMTLLDALRETLGLTGTKKACDRGECGACTVHIEGRRVLSCMALVAMQDGKRITTIEGLERDGKL